MMKDTDKDMILLFGIAVFVSSLYYYVYQNCVYTRLDYYCMFIGIFLPFIIIGSIYIKYVLETPEYIWGF